MENQYPWKRTQEIEIDLADLLGRFMKKWKQAAACALAFAVILGAYGWFRGRAGSDIGGADAAQEMELTEEEERAVADAVRLAGEVSSLEEYLDNSVLMQLDPYHKDKQVMLYSIDRAKRQELPRITESYLNYISNGGALDALQKSGSPVWDMDKCYLSELISAYQKTYSSPYQVVAEGLDGSRLESESLFYVEITGMDEKMAKQMALDMQSVLESYCVKAKETAGGHKLTLVGSEKNTTADSSLQTQQHDKKALLSSGQANLKAMTDAFNKVQTAAYREAAGVEAKEDGLEEADGGFFSIFRVKYIVLGLFGGLFVYAGLFYCWYLMCDTVKSVEEMKRLYTFPVYAGIPLNGMAPKTGRVEKGAGQDAYGLGEAQLLNRIRLACKKYGIEKLCAASDVCLSAGEKACLGRIAAQLLDSRITMAIVENVGSSPNLWEELPESGHILLVCKTGKTTHRVIDRIMEFYFDNGITVIGAAAFS